MLSRVCDLLDRKLFETSVAAEVTGIAATAKGFEETVAQVLGVLQRFVDNDVAGVLLVEERGAYVAVARESSRRHYTEFPGRRSRCARCGDRYRRSPSTTWTCGSWTPTRTSAREDEGRMATFLSMPLRGHGGRVIGVLALSSAAKNAFSETALGTLRLVEDPAAIVIDNARPCGRPTTARPRCG